MSDAFELLKALKALSETAGPVPRMGAHPDAVRPPRTRWWVERHGVDQTLRVEIPLAGDEAEFIEQMRLMFAPVDQIGPRAQAEYLVDQLVREANEALRPPGDEDWDRWKRRGVEIIKEITKALRDEPLTHAEANILNRKKDEIAYVVLGVPPRLEPEQPAEGGMQERRES